MLLLSLSVIGVFAVLAEVMLIQQLLLHPHLIWIQLQRVEVHERDFFQHNGVMDCFVRVLAPGEGAVAVN